MPRNLGATSLKRRSRRGQPMREYDGLPKGLREWLASAVLPWRAGSALVTYKRAMARTGSTDLALKELDRLQRALVAKDVRRIWGQDHPAAQDI